jgi:hypothetical protein
MLRRAQTPGVGPLPFPFRTTGSFVFMTCLVKLQNFSGLNGRLLPTMDGGNTQQRLHDPERCKKIRARAHHFHGVREHAVSAKNQTTPQA